MNLIIYSFFTIQSFITVKHWLMRVFTDVQRKSHHGRVSTIMSQSYYFTIMHKHFITVLGRWYGDCERSCFAFLLV